MQQVEIIMRAQERKSRDKGLRFRIWMELGKREGVDPEKN